MKLNQRDIIRHLDLALAGDDAHLRTAVEHLVAVLKQTKVKGQGVPKYAATWSQGRDGSTIYWEVTCDREDAKQVEELWTDFASRKKIEGLWRTHTIKGKVIPIRREGQLMAFRFYERKPMRRVTVKKKGEKKKSPTDEILSGFANLPAKQRDQLLALLLTKTK